MSDCCTTDASSFNAREIMACPANGARSKKVDTLTVKSLVRTLPLEMPNTQYYFCEAPDCDVVYFASLPKAPIFSRADLLITVGAKQSAPPIPLCYCFGFTQQNIADELAVTGRSTIAETIKAEIKAGNCACEVKNPSGKCCLGNIGRAVKNATPALK